MRGLRERLSASERTVDGLKADLSATVTKRDHGQAEVHQARLQAAQLTLQLADSSLAFREARAHWAQEQQHLQHTAEVRMWLLCVCCVAVQPKGVLLYSPTFCCCTALCFDMALHPALRMKKWNTLLIICA